MLFFGNVSLFILASFSANEQCFVYNKSGSTSQLFKVNQELQKLLYYLSGTVTSVFVTVARGYWSIPSGSPGGHGVRTYVFAISFALYVNELPSEASLSISSISCQ